MFRSNFINIFVIVFIFTLTPFPFNVTYAYLDAGTGSMVIQAIIAGTVGLLFVIKIFWQKIKSFFHRILKK